MITPNNGGPAFAAPGMPAYSAEGIPLNPWAGHGWAHDPQPGMSLRDYFAIHASPLDVEGVMPSTVGALGVWLGVEEYEWEFHYPMAVTKARYILADAMLAARATGKAEV